MPQQPPLPIGAKITRGKEFEVYEYGATDILKLPRRPRLMRVAFGDFRRKCELDLEFLETHFADYLPVTAIITAGEAWGIRQQKIAGTPFFARPEMTPCARAFLTRAVATYRETRRIPDILNPGNLVCEQTTGRLFLIDTSALGGRRCWPVGFLVSRFLGKVLFDTVNGWLKFGFPSRRS